MRNPQPGGRLSEDTEHLPRERWVGLRVTMWTGGDLTELPPSLCPNKHHLLLAMERLEKAASGPTDHCLMRVNIGITSPKELSRCSLLAITLGTPRISQQVSGTLINWRVLSICSLKHCQPPFELPCVAWPASLVNNTCEPSWSLGSRHLEWQW